MHPEWAWAIAHAGKWVENRTWFPPDALIGERIAIHAGARIRDLPRAIETARATGLQVRRLPESVVETVRGRGAEIEVEGRRTAVWTSAIVATAVLHSVVGHELDTPWQVPGHLAWILTEVRVLDRAVPATGRLGLWTWDGPQ